MEKGSSLAEREQAATVLVFDPVRTAAWLICLIIIIALLVVGRPLLVPLSIAFLVWVLLDAIRVAMIRFAAGKFPLPRSLATIGAIALVVVANYLVVSIVAGQIDAVRAAIPMYQENFAAITGQFVATIGIDELPSVQSMLQQLDFAAVLTWIGDSVSGLFADIILIAVYVGFLLGEENILPAKLKLLQRDQERGDQIVNVVNSISVSVQRYIGMKTLVSALTALISYGVLKIVGVDFAEIWALLIFFLNFIPNIGSILGVAFPALLTLVQFDTFGPFFIVAVGLGAVQFVIGNIIEPAYMGKSLNLSSLMILISLTFWGFVWGLPGMFLSVPIMVVVAIVCAHVEGLRWLSIVLSGTEQQIVDK